MSISVSSSVLKDYTKDNLNEYVRVEVQNCFDIKDKLKKRGYKFDGDRKVWVLTIEKQIARNALKKESKFFEKVNAEIPEGFLKCVL